MKVENQLEFVRNALNATPTDEWDVLASAAQVTKRHLYNIANSKGSPSYDTVYALMRVFETRRNRAKVPA